MTSAAHASSDEAPYVDVLIVGAGLSGIGAACHLQNDVPGLTFEVLEARGDSGGTWDLFRYPGVRSDSDMYTLGYSFKPWTGATSIADGADILAYIRQTATDHRIDDRIRYNTKVVSAAWSSSCASWTVTVEDALTGASTTRTCAFLYLCSGFYRYDEGYTPTWPGQADFTGQIIHPQHWPADLDLTGKQVVIVGSGATAVTLVPAIAQDAASVTMLQRSPSYVMPLPAADPVADLLRKVLPAQRAYQAIRWKNVRTSTLIYSFSRKQPTRTRALLRRIAVRALPKGFDVDTHFTPTYQPWDQRMCLVPDGDFFKAIKNGSADVVTDQIDAFTPTSLRLRSGAELTADVVVTATGLNLLPLAGIALTVDGSPITISERVAYKGMMLDGVPNLAFALGYTNASWTLKVDLVSTYLARMLSHMRRHNLAVVTPELPAEQMVTSPYIEMSSGYFERSRSELPRQGDRAPWRLQQHYRKDSALFTGPVTDPTLRYDAGPPAAAAVIAMAEQKPGRTLSGH